MGIPKNVEDFAYQAVQMGELEIDPEGRIWRVAARRGNRWDGGTQSIPCRRRRAERGAPYLTVRVMVDGKRVTTLAQRLVWRHFNGPIPAGLTVNHKNGRKTDNTPSNLELATHAEQVLHARQVLQVGRLDQNGEKNAMAKLTEEQVLLIRDRRGKGEPLRVIAADYGVTDRAISKIARRQRWAFLG